MKKPVGVWILAGLFLIWGLNGLRAVLASEAGPICTLDAATQRECHRVTGPPF